MSIEDIVSKFSRLTINSDKLNDDIIDITSSLKKLTFQCKNNNDIDNLCTELDELCLKSGVDSFLLKSIVSWFNGKSCGIGINKVHYPKWTDCH